ncbi:hypothetical protein EGW08_022071 [Elysia chlorotica]|uniref:Uncharacterized protein n=1 Tax=Elysia chlorotica TaxID=188477 RepID=A0A3S1ARP0_ELYCH|nr:hypothetical protein EGW08_022071 [Elysia chlorotica]
MMCSQFFIYYFIHITYMVWVVGVVLCMMVWVVGVVLCMMVWVVGVVLCMMVWVVGVVLCMMVWVVGGVLCMVVWVVGVVLCIMVWFVGLVGTICISCSDRYRWAFLIFSRTSLGLTAPRSPLGILCVFFLLFWVQFIIMVHLNIGITDIFTGLWL